MTHHHHRGRHYAAPANHHSIYDRECLRLEGVTVSVGFDDLLDETLALNHPHFDTIIVVTSHQDHRTQAVAKKHGAFCVQSDLFGKNGRNFNKGAAINSGMAYWQYHGWRIQFDADTAMPDNFRRMLFNHTHLDRSCIYGADRVDVVGKEAIRKLHHHSPQHLHSCLVEHREGPVGARYIDKLRGYVPLGFFQMWHAQCQKPYPYSLGSAEHDDVMFASLWPESQRRHLPSVICYHLCGQKPSWGENWDGHRRQPRIS